jgi:hypothetical protein
MSLPEEQRPFNEPSSPIGRTPLGLAALFMTPSLKKKVMEMATDLLMTNLSSTRGSHQARRLQKVILTMVNIHYPSKGKDD